LFESHAAFWRAETTTICIAVPKPCFNAVRKLSAILFILVICILQFARLFIYIDCKFSNNFKPVALQCNCEKKAGLDKAPEKNPSQRHAHKHFQADEYFLAENKEEHEKTHHSTSTFAGITDKLQAGFCNIPWHPPADKYHISFSPLTTLLV
jgi:hypothetical protein